MKVGDKFKRFEVVDVIEKADAPPRTRILWENGLEQSIDGSVLEHIAELGDRSLLFISENCPYEEALHIFLFHKNGEILDQVELSLPYTAGIFSLIQQDLNNTFSFSFFSGLITNLRVLDEPLFSFFNNQRGLKRKKPFHSKTFFKIRHK